MAHVTEEEMFHLADGDITSEEKKRLIDHISSCESCKKQMSSILSFNEELQRFWDEYLSGKCPDKETIFAFMGNELGENELASVEEHLSECSVCRHKVESIRESLAEIERLEHASEVQIPSLINRIKQHLGKSFNKSKAKVKLQAFLD